jgi:outer membrane protein OmpA-like peptidoglycan-associated protein
MGSAAYNQKLSERRAKNTAKALGDRGVKVDSASGKGFTEPAVNTGPNVKEPLNRRAVIKLHEGMTQ